MRNYASSTLMAFAGAFLLVACGDSPADPPVDPGTDGAPASSSSSSSSPDATPPPPPPVDAGGDTAPQDASKPDAAPEKCGATEAKKCADGLACAGDNDCTSRNCNALVCAPATCTNSKNDGDEEGIDCGGTKCKKCDGATCAAGPECTSGVCFLNKCAPPGTKTCGVGLPTLCADAEPCQADLDCTSDVCEGRVCVAVTAAAHSDGRRNAGETGVDCGGSIKATKVCPAGQGCVDATDCEAAVCAAGLCGAPTRTDGKFSPSLGETDIDCGGTLADSLGNPAVKCVSTKACKVGGDCDSGFCTGLVCEPRKAGRKDGDESDVDCGGGVDPDLGVAAPRCDDARACGGDTDCASAVCYGAVCIGGQSCANAATSGITTCGRRESNNAARVHESCCRALPVPGLPLRIGKYEVTSGRVRQFITAVGPNLRAWAAGEIAAGSPIGLRLSRQLPANVLDLLPSTAATNQPLNLIVQLGAGVMDKRTPSMSQGCYNGPDAYGHATYWQPVATLRSMYGASFPARRFTQAQYDEKPMNCAPNWIYAAFCAWDGGRLPTRDEYDVLWGADAYPWGPTRYVTLGVTNYELTVNWGNAIPGKTPDQGQYFYHYPNYGDGADVSGYIAAPGRFPLDLTALRTADDEGWHDVGANLMEMTEGEPGTGTFCDFGPRAAGEVTSASCVYNVPGGGTENGVLRVASGMGKSVWQGGSYEGHGSFEVEAVVPFRREWYKGTNQFTLPTQYGKTGFRCAYDP
jgi:hypothetical protein